MTTDGSAPRCAAPETTAPTADSAVIWPALTGVAAGPRDPVGRTPGDGVLGAHRQAIPAATKPFPAAVSVATAPTPPGRTAGSAARSCRCPPTRPRRGRRPPCRPRTAPGRDDAGAVSHRDLLEQGIGRAGRPGHVVDAPVLAVRGGAESCGSRRACPPRRSPWRWRRPRTPRWTSPAIEAAVAAARPVPQVAGPPHGRERPAVAHLLADDDVAAAAGRKHHHGDARRGEGDGVDRLQVAPSGGGRRATGCWLPSKCAAPTAIQPAGPWATLSRLSVPGRWETADDDAEISVQEPSAARHQDRGMAVGGAEPRAGCRPLPRSS